MGYSSPKKQLDLKEFLSQPGTPPRNRNFWKRAASRPLDNAKTKDTEVLSKKDQEHTR